MEKKSILKWIENLTNEGKELSIGWDGGGDSGWCFFEVDGDQVSNEYTEALVDYMYDHLDYGSWAGEFHANGKATYNPTTRTFEGIDYYGEDDTQTIDGNITIKVPKELWFDALHVEVEATYDESTSMSVRFIIKNGFLTKEHSEFCSNLEEILKDEFDALFSNYESTDHSDFRGCTDIWTLERKDAIEEDDMLVFNITKVDIQVIENTENDIVLELTDDLINSIDEKLN